MLNFDWLSGISQEMAKNIFLALFVLIAVLVLMIPNEYAYEGVEKEDRHWWNNLKIWSIFVLSILFFIYYIF
ncbi:hypothetical protein K8352_15730 [Flavobacteriaceae bacterium F89]|uniref:Uncharacterized protein n=1 Tax=Cerina litoralis TaxID=2874477 RepID=A0AAE3JPK3_9FLAO|nr:hypothetical protein [Cerina litoralis]MCG2462210.1 hypothetical protein [Cerina litoralis]